MMIFAGSLHGPIMPLRPAVRKHTHTVLAGVSLPPNPSTRPHATGQR